jgi:type I restriction enzyme S subunit
MNNNWKSKDFEDCLEKITYTNKIQRKEFLEVGDYPIISQEQDFINGYWNNEDDLFKVKKPVVIFGDHTQVLKYVDFDFVLGADGVKILQPINDINPKYLFYFLMNAEFKTLGYARHYRLLKELSVPIPLLPEQQRMVAILDEAFAAIAQAKENAEKNLQNARELFDSYLQSVFANPGDGWEEKNLEDLADERCTLSYGIVQPGEEFSDGLPVIRPTDMTKRFIGLNGLKRINPKLADGYKRTKLVGDELLLCVRGSTGIVSIALKELEGANVTRGIVPIRFNSKIINQEYGYYLLTSNYVQKQIKAKTYGTALMQINIGDLRKIQAPFPSLKNQQTIVQKMDALSTETKKLESIYRQKINDLDELKKSILQKAFNGELTASNRVSNVIEFPVRIPNISTTDLQAGIVAIAHQRHQEKGNILTFGHVKAEKVVHLAESVLGIELDRNPVKDAAGPNDFPHLKKVESRAEKAGYFKTIKKAYGYEYAPGSQFDNLIEKTKTALNAKTAKLINLIDLLVPMDTQQAELVATVYAAWNNLLIDNLTINDESIVTEARENWHDAKLNIPRERFFNTIAWMKEQNLIPHGKGKKVSAKK